MEKQCEEGTQVVKLKRVQGARRQLLSSVQSLSRVLLFATPWTAALQASLSFTDSRSLLKLMSIESVMPSSHLILCHPLLLLPSIFPSIRVFSTESPLRIRYQDPIQNTTLYIVIIFSLFSLTSNLKEFISLSLFFMALTVFLECW